MDISIEIKGVDDAQLSRVLNSIELKRTCLNDSKDGTSFNVTSPYPNLYAPYKLTKIAFNNFKVVFDE